MEPNDLLTKKDLADFKRELFALLEARPNVATNKWLKTTDVKRMLGISHSSLMNLRVSGELPYSKIGGLYFYKQDDVEQMLEKAQKKSPKRSRKSALKE